MKKAVHSLLSMPRACVELDGTIAAAPMLAAGWGMALP
jgi:hypothetical protein